MFAGLTCFVDISGRGPKLDDVDVAGFESASGFRLPMEYRRFLMQYNGGAPSPDTGDVGGLPGSPTGVQRFFGLKRWHETSNLPWNLSLIQERRPDDRLLPIARDSGG